MAQVLGGKGSAFVEVDVIESLLQRDRGLVQRMEAMELALRKRGKKKYFITIA